MSHSQKPEHKQQKQYCNTVNKEFKNGPHQENIKKQNNKASKA